MNITTKTGLIASPRKRIVRPRKEFDPAVLAPCAITRQVPLALRPFGGLYNPYSKGCSVLCNHPAAQEVKNVVRLAKDAWITEAKVANLHGHAAGGLATAAMATAGAGAERKGPAMAVDADGKALLSGDGELPDHVPEEFFRRYTDTDSRPLTPTPTVASGRTRVSVGGSHLTRRCVTPEPQTANGQERKQLILDLRRSHSQETLYWNASSELSPSQLQDGDGWGGLGHRAGGGGGGGVGGTSAGGGGGDAGGGGAGGPAAQSAVADDTGRAAAAGGGGGEEMKLRGESDTEYGGRPPGQPMTCINAMDDGEEDPPRRRGKRRKKSKQLTQTISFVPNQDPETQIAKIDPDSPNYSARPSLVPTGKSLLSYTQDLTPPAGFGVLPGDQGVGDGQPAEEDCFLDDESLGLLRRGLNIDFVEVIFERYKGRAIREAFRTATMDKLNFQTEAVRTLQRSMKQMNDVDYEKWIDLPRKYSRSSARFELPIDTRKLTRMTPIEYLHDYVVLSGDRKQLYHRIFVRNLPREEPKTSGGTLESIDSDSLPETETGPIEVDSTRNLLADVTRFIPMECFDRALHEALGFHGTPERIAAIRELLELNYDPFHELQIDFRTWCGIVAFAERYINTLDREQDPCDELEMVDFESLERRVRWAHPCESLCQVLQIIKYH